MPLWTRRQLLSLAPTALLSASAWAGSRRTSSDERCFLFVFCRGGWDTTYCFTPPGSGVDGDPSGTEATANGITFVDSEERPSVRSFFENYGDQAAVLNGVEVRSITHERCQQFVMTGRADTAADDWPTLLATHSEQDLLLPHLVLSGPVYVSEGATQVVRMGGASQFAELLDGSALHASDRYVNPPDDAVQAMVDAYVAERTDRFAAATSGRSARFADAYGTVLHQIEQLDSFGGSLWVDSQSEMTFCGTDPLGEASTILDCFDLGLTRCGIIEYAGWCQSSFDSHSGNEMQSWHFEELFTILSEIVPMIASRGLEDRVTVVVLSEMGREPQLNAAQGKGHWTYTSAMLLGAGVRGGQVVGAMDEDFFGRPIDLNSGEVTDAGISLRATHLGATLLELGGVDPGPYVETGVEAIRVLIG